MFLDGCGSLSNTARREEAKATSRTAQDPDEEHHAAGSERDQEHRSGLSDSIGADNSDTGSSDGNQKRQPEHALKQIQTAGGRLLAVATFGWCGRHLDLRISYIGHDNVLTQ